MREPVVTVEEQEDDGSWKLVRELPFSQCPAEDLHDYINGGVRKGPNADEWYDLDFRKRYATILLKERGL